MNRKAIIFLADGMADEPLPELGGKTPLEAAHTPAMDSIARDGVNGTFLTLPEGLPTSSDVANMSVLGFYPERNYPGRGPIEAVSQGIELGPDDVAFRCNLVYVSDDGVLRDYSAGHIDNETAAVLMNDLQKQFGSAIDKKKIVLESEIKSFGTYKAEVRLHPEVKVSFYVTITEE